MRSQTVKFARHRLALYDTKTVYTYTYSPSRYGYKVTARVGATRAKSV